MPIEDFGQPAIFSLLGLASATKAFFILFLVFYIVFALILFRQVQLMGKALPTVVVPFLRFAAIVHIGIALSLFFLVLGLF